MNEPGKKFLLRMRGRKREVKLWRDGQRKRERERRGRRWKEEESCSSLLSFFFLRLLLLSWITDFTSGCWVSFSLSFRSWYKKNIHQVLGNLRNEQS